MKNEIKPRYSIVVPVYNEEEVLHMFYERVIGVMDGVGEPYEIVMVNDGSRDNTEQILKELAEKDARVKVCNFSRNFGHQSALLCGLAHASGDAVIDMDADLQDPPELVTQMIAKWKEGYDVVHGKRAKRKGESVFKKVTAYFYYKALAKITGLDIPRNTGDFKLLDRKVVDSILSLNEHERLLRVQTTWVGYKQTYIEFERPARAAGETKYTLKKMITLAHDGIVPNSVKLLSLPVKLGLVATVLSLVCIITFIILSAAGVNYGGLVAWIFPALGICLSVYLLTSGLTNVYLASIFKEVQNRPHYIVRDKINLN